MNKCQRCIALGEINQEIEELLKELNIAMSNQDNLDVVLTSHELDVLSQERISVAAEPCLCEQ